MLGANVTSSSVKPIPGTGGAGTARPPGSCPASHVASSPWRNPVSASCHERSCPRTRLTSSASIARWAPADTAATSQTSSLCGRPEVTCQPPSASRSAISAAALKVPPGPVRAASRGTAPRASVAKSSWVFSVAFAVGMNAPKGFFVAGLIAAKWVRAVPKMWP
jgi:hypothetical protein